MRWRLLVNSLERTGARDRLERLSLAIDQVGPIIALVLLAPSAIGLAALGGYAGYWLAAGQPGVTFEVVAYRAPWHVRVRCRWSAHAPVDAPYGHRSVTPAPDSTPNAVLCASIRRAQRAMDHHRPAGRDVPAGRDAHREGLARPGRRPARRVAPRGLSRRPFDTLLPAPPSRRPRSTPGRAGGLVSHRLDSGPESAAAAADPELRPIAERRAPGTGARVDAGLGLAYRLVRVPGRAV